MVVVVEEEEEEEKEEEEEEEEEEKEEEEEEKEEEEWKEETCRGRIGLEGVVAEAEVEERAVLVCPDGSCPRIGCA